MKSLLLVVNPDPGHEARLATAIALAKGRGGHIICIQVLVAPLAIGDPDSAVVASEMMLAVEKVAREFQEDVEVRLETAGVEWTWERLYGDAAATVISHARLADAVILSAEGPYPTVGSVAPHARIPVMAVPETDPGFDARSPALVAWNGSHPAANALRLSLPLLREADSVHILAVDGDSEDFPAARAHAYLSHHAIASEIHWRHSDGKPVADAILAAARRLGTGLVVAGAFGHNRLREMLLGSVTRALLRDSPFPLLVAH